MTTETAREIAPDDAMARRNVLVLAIATALAGGNAAVVIATAGLIGQMLAGPTLATAPVTSFVVGTAIATVPASLLMVRVGRRIGFIIGTLFGAAAGFLGAFAIYAASFPLFLVATACAGIYQAFVTLYRFAAADTASAAFRPKAISLVLTGGVFAALLGPQLVIFTKDLAPPYLFLASYLAQGVVALVASIVVGFVSIPKPGQTVVAGGRALAEIIRNPAFVVAVLCGTAAHALMNFVMTATPLAMVGCGHSITDAALAIQWHIIGMYAPSFFTGTLIARYGKVPILIAGFALIAAGGVVAIAGLTVWHFWVSLVLLGLGWNFGFIAATAMVADTHAPAERGKVQGFNDFVVFGTTALGSFLSGKVLSAGGWEIINAAMFPFLAVCVVAILLQRRMARGAAAG